MSDLTAAPAAPSQSPTQTPSTPAAETNTPIQPTADTSLNQGTPAPAPRGEEGSTESQPAPQEDSRNAFERFSADRQTAPPAAEGSEDPGLQFNGEAEGGEVADWKENLPMSMRDDTYVNRFGSMEEFLKGVKNLQALASKKGLERPAPDAPPEAWNDYWDTVGRPSSPEEYAIENIKDSTGADVFEFDADLLSQLKPEFHKQGMTNEQAQFTMDKYAELKVAEQAQKQEAYEARTLETLTNLQKDYKETTNATIDRSLRVLENLGIYDTLVEQGLETSEPFIRLGIQLSQDYSEAVTGPRGSVRDSQSRLMEIEASPAFRNANDPNHKAVINERNEILRRMS